MNTNKHKDFAIFKSTVKYNQVKGDGQNGVDNKTIAFITDDGTIRTHNATFGGRTQYVAGNGISIQGDTISVDESILNLQNSNFDLSEHVGYVDNDDNYGVKLANNKLYVTVPKGNNTLTVTPDYTEIAFYSSSDTSRPQAPNPPHDTTIYSAKSLNIWCKYAFDDNPNVKSIWMSTRTYIGANAQFTSWCEPIQIAGSDGNSGADGKNGINGDYNEYIYALNNNETLPPSLNTSAIQQDDYIPSGWNDNPQGVSLNNKYEWMAWRRKTYNNNNVGTWSNFYSPVLWSAYGKQGTDGDGVEYIYYANAEGIAPTTNLPSTWTNDANFLEREYIRSGSGWTDDPSYTGIDDMPQGAKVWVSVRKKYADEGTVESEGAYWHAYSAPSLWTYKAKDGSAAQEGVSVTGSLDKSELQIPIKKDTGYNYRFNNSVALTGYVNASASPVHNLRIDSIVDTDQQAYNNPSWLTVNGNFISFNIPEDTLEFNDGKQITITFTGYVTAKGSEVPITKSVVLVGSVYDPTGQTPMTPSNKVITEAQYNTMKAQYDNWKENGVGENPFIENCVYTVVNNMNDRKILFWVMYTNGTLIQTFPPQPAAIPEPETIEVTEEEYNALKNAGLSFTKESGKLNYYATYIIKRDGNIIGYGIAGTEVLLPNEIPIETTKFVKVLARDWATMILTPEASGIQQDTYYYIYDIIDGESVVIALYKGTLKVGDFANPSTLVSQSDITSIWKQKIEIAMLNKENGEMDSDDEDTFDAVSTTFAGFLVTDDYDTWMGVIRNSVKEGLIDSATFTATIDEITGQIAAGQRVHKDLQSLMGLKNKSIEASVDTVIERTWVSDYADIPQDRKTGGYYAPALDIIDDNDYAIKYVTEAQLSSIDEEPKTLYLVTEHGKEGEAITYAVYSPETGGRSSIGFYYYTSAINLSAEQINAIANQFNFATLQDLNGVSSNIQVLSNRISNIVSAPNKVTQLNIENGIITLQSLTFDSLNGQWQNDGNSANITEMVGLAIDGNQNKIELIAKDVIAAGDAEIKGNMTAGTINIGDNFSVDASGNMTASNANFSGQITASTIYGDTIISGSTIQNSTILHKVIREVTPNVQDASIGVFTGTTADNIELRGDTLLILGPYSSEQRVALPPAKFFPGAMIRIINGTKKPDGNGTEAEDPSFITLEVIHDSATEAAVEDAYNEEMNSIAVSTLVKGRTGTLLPYGYRTNAQLGQYRTIELISNQNWWAGTDSPYYVWMIVDAR